MQSAAQKTDSIVSDRERRGAGTSTANRIAKTGAPIDITASGIQLVMDWPLQVIYLKGSLGKADEGKARYEAGKRFYEHWYLSGMAPMLRGVDLNSIGGGSSGRGPWPATERAYAHRQAFRSAQTALGSDRISSLVALIVLNEVDIIKAGKSVYKREDTEQVRALAIEGLKDGLDRLVKHWE